MIWLGSGHLQNKQVESSPQGTSLIEGDGIRGNCLRKPESSGSFKRGSKETPAPGLYGLQAQSSRLPWANEH